MTRGHLLLRTINRACFRRVGSRGALIALATTATRMAAVHRFTAQDDEDLSQNAFPKEPITLPKDDSLTQEFLLRQSSILSANAATRLLTHVVVAIEAAFSAYKEASQELANLYEMSAGKFTLTDAGEERVLDLKMKIAEKRKQLDDLELLFQYVKKLMDANAEVTFLSGEEFVSKQASEAIHSAEQHMMQLLEKSRLLQLEVLQARQHHIEKTPVDTNVNNDDQENVNAKSKSDPVVSSEEEENKPV